MHHHHPAAATTTAAAAVNVLADHVAANNMSARHISELRRDLVPDPDIALLAQLSTAAGITLRCVLSGCVVSCDALCCVV